MTTLRGIIFVGLMLALSACTNLGEKSEIEALNQAQAVGSPFTQNLAAEYRAYANNELNKMFDYPDAIHFARKGLATAGGTTVMPEPISDWNLLPEHMAELGTARGRLIVAFDVGAREIAPALAAKAQARFDCWIEQQEENWQASDIIGCKNEFLAAIAELEDMLQPSDEEAMEPIENLPLEPVEPLKPEDAMYLVFFDWDSYAIGSGGENVLDAVAEEIKGRNLEIVHIVGHTDSSGPEAYNDKLAMKRATTVRDALVNRGIDPNLIRIEGRGENELLVDTLDNVREPANRRAQITFE